jgi:hypothetical protein
MPNSGAGLSPFDRRLDPFVCNYSPISDISAYTYNGNREDSYKEPHVYMWSRHVRCPCITVFKHEILNKFKSLKTIKYLTYALHNIYMTRTTVQLLQYTVNIYTVSGINVSNLLPMLPCVSAKCLSSNISSFFSFVYSCTLSCSLRNFRCK